MTEITARALRSPARLALALLLLLVGLPLSALLAYALAERWDGGWLPQGLTLHWLDAALWDPLVQIVALRTLRVAAVSTVLVLVLGGGASLSASLAASLDPTPATRRVLSLLDLLALLPYALPPVVIAIGALDLWLGRAGDLGVFIPRPVLYVALVVPTLFPLVHRVLRASLAQLEASTLVEAGRTLGASDLMTLRRVLLPLLAPALGTAALVAFATATMEFTVANLLLGGDWQLLQPLLNGMRGASGAQAAALALLSLGAIALPAACAQALAVRSRVPRASSLP